jgi:hypothetical protein
MANLYTLAEQYVKLNEMIEDALDNLEESGIVEDDLQMFIDTLDSIDDSIEVKVENICKFLKNINGDIEIFKKEEQRIAKRRKTLENKHDGIKGYLESMLRLMNKKEVITGTFTVKFQKSPASVNVISEKDIPSEYKEPVPDKILKKEILAALKDKKAIPGVLLVDDNTHMRIR